jgi:hypothetical protein
MDLFVRGDLIRIKNTGEIFIYVSSVGAANWRSYLTIGIRSMEFEIGSYWIDNVEKVNADGSVIDDFSQYKHVR